jgi:hypothetical protein
MDLYKEIKYGWLRQFLLFLHNKRLTVSLKMDDPMTYTHQNIC